MIKLPARIMLDLLACRITQDEFLDIQHFGNKTRNFFADELDCGRLISNIRIERQPSRDDDWIVIEFEGPDAAISPYRVPMIANPKRS